MVARPRATLGFPVSITTPGDRKYRNAVAEVLITVDNGPISSVRRFWRSWWIRTLFK